MHHPEFLDFEERFSSLSKAGDPLEVLLQTVDVEIFHRASEQSPEIF